MKYARADTHLLWDVLALVPYADVITMHSYSLSMYLLPCHLQDSQICQVASEQIFTGEQIVD